MAWRRMYGSRHLVPTTYSGGTMPRMPSETTRNYTRTSVSTGGTQQSQDNVMMQNLMGGNPNQDQMGQLAKSAIGG